MVEPAELSELAPIDVAYAPQLGHRALPVEVVSRRDLVARIAGHELASRQRTDFYQLVVCTGGSGIHIVDFERVEMRPGTVLRIFPGQVQGFVPEPWFDADMVLWPVASHHEDPTSPRWYPGCGATTHWQIEGEFLAELRLWVEQMRLEQDRFDGSARRLSLMKAMLCVMLLRLAIEYPEVSDGAGRLPKPYLDYRQLIEDRLFDRPSVKALARELGYSSRTLDRACQEVTGQTSRQVLDERIALEARRLLTHTTRATASIARDLGFSDPSNFSKFIKRHTGQLPGELRPDASPPRT